MTRDHPQEENLVSFSEIVDIDSNLKNEFEMDQKFNMEYILGLIDELSTEETVWQSVKETMEISVFTCHDGSSVNSTLPMT